MNRIQIRVWLPVVPRSVVAIAIPIWLTIALAANLPIVQNSLSEMLEASGGGTALGMVLGLVFLAASLAIWLGAITDWRQNAALRSTSRVLWGVIVHLLFVFGGLIYYLRFPRRLLPQR